MIAVAFILGFLAGEAFLFLLGLYITIRRDNAKASQQATRDREGTLDSGTLGT